MNRAAHDTAWTDPRSFDATDDESECVEDMLGVVRHYEKLARQARRSRRFGFANRAGRASPRARILGLVHAATTAIAVFCVIYFGGQLLRGVL